MRLRGIDFGYVMNSSGARGFFGEGYWFHRWFSPIGLRYYGATFVAKTTTLEPRKGNMPLRGDGVTPRNLFPECIRVNPFQGVTLNAVSLSGPGARDLLSRGIWQRFQRPFFISFMSVAQGPLKRLEELKEFVHLLQEYLPKFRAPLALEMNFTCPNVGLEVAVSTLVAEIRVALDIASHLRIPLVPKLNAAFPVEVGLEVVGHDACDAVCMGNTIPWGHLREKINWYRLFNSNISPLARLGGGGLSGKPLLPVVSEWIRTARARGFKKPIVGCGGILSSDDARRIFDAGASAIQLGSVSILRPWRVQGIIRFANEYAKVI